MKALLEFNLPEDAAEHKMAIRGREAHRALWETVQQVFRPARKHGYDDVKLNALIDANPDATEIIRLLEDRFHEILNAADINLNDCY